MELTKFITGPHDLTLDQTELFDEVVKRGGETLLEGSPEAKGKGIVAIVQLSGVHGDTTTILSRKFFDAPTPRRWDCYRLQCRSQSNSRRSILSTVDYRRAT